MRCTSRLPLLFFGAAVIMSITMASAATELVPDAEAFKDFRSRLEKLAPQNSDLSAMRDELVKESTLAGRRRTISSDELTTLTNRISAMIRLVDNEKYARKTGLSDAPFALVELAPCPEKLSAKHAVTSFLPPDGVFTAELRVAAAKGEFEPVSLMIFPYKDLTGLTLSHSEFKSAEGNVLPASVLTLRPGPDTASAGQGLFRQYLLHAPKDAKPGLYRGTVTAAIGGKTAGTFPITVRVYPFELPAPATQADPNEEYITALAGDAVTASVLADHNIRHGIADTPAVGETFPGTYAEDISARRAAGLPLKPFFVMGRSGGDAYAGLFTPGGDIGARLVNGAISADALSKHAGELKKLLGHDEIYYFYGMNDNAKSSPFGTTIFSSPYGVLTAGWEENYQYIPTHRVIHAQCGPISRTAADRWHAMRQKLLVSAAGLPESPNQIRRTYGIRAYRANCDGFLIQASGLAADDAAFDALREGIDDVRYITVLRALLRKAYAENHLDALYAAKKAVAWFELTDAQSINLDLMRYELADHIANIQRQFDKKQEAAK